VPPSLGFVLGVLPNFAVGSYLPFLAIVLQTFFPPLARIGRSPMRRFAAWAAVKDELIQQSWFKAYRFAFFTLIILFAALQLEGVLASLTRIAIRRRSARKPYPAKRFRCKTEPQYGINREVDRLPLIRNGRESSTERNQNQCGNLSFLSISHVH